MNTLQDHQQGIGELLDRMKQAVDADGAKLFCVISQSRWKLVRALRTYQLFKHTELFTPLRNSSDADRARLASEMNERCVAAGDAFNAYAKRWAGHSPQEHWTKFEAETREIVAAIRHHLERERQDAARLVDGLSRTRRP